MRHIKKNPHYTNSNLARAIESGPLPIDSDSATRAWRRFSDAGHLLESTLLKEQFGLCCYTELNLIDFYTHHSMNSHFEHEKPKSLFPTLIFDYKNLLLSSLSSEDLSRLKGGLCFAGHHKLSLFDATKFVSPQDPHCSEYFVYSEVDGEISPNLSFSFQMQEKAKYTIDLLNLNAPFLKAERRKWLQEITVELDKLVALQNVPAIEQLAECELTLTERKHPILPIAGFEQLRPFHSATRALFGAVGQRVIQTCCPYID